MHTGRYEYVYSERILSSGRVAAAGALAAEQQPARAALRGC